MSVQTTAPAKAVTGKTAKFTSVVTNAGPDAATSVALSLTVSGGLTPSNISCIASGGTVCPPTGVSMTAVSIPKDATLTFTTTVDVPSTGTGPLEVKMQSTSADDTAAGNDASAASAAMIDQYKVFSSDGMRYSMDLDRAANTIEMTNPANSVTSRPFTGTANPYTIDAMQQFRIGEDLVVGSFDFGSGAGVVPFIAARKFITDPAMLPNDSGVILSRISSSGDWDTQVFTYQFSGSQLMTCRGSGLIQPVSGCTGGNITYTYPLAVNGDEFSGVDASNGSDSVAFSVAMSGSTAIYLTAANGTTDTNYRLRIGLPVTVNPVQGQSFGGTTRNETGNITYHTDVDGTDVWVQTYDGTQTYNFGFDDTSPLIPGLWRGTWLDTNTSENFSFFTTSSPVLNVFMGVRGQTGWNKGFMMLTAP